MDLREAKAAHLQEELDGRIEEENESTRKAVAHKTAYYAASGFDLAGTPTIVINGMWEESKGRKQRLRQRYEAQIEEVLACPDDAVTGQGDTTPCWRTLQEWINRLVQGSGSKEAVRSRLRRGILELRKSTNDDPGRLAKAGMIETPGDRKILLRDDFVRDHVDLTHP